MTITTPKAALYILIFVSFVWGAEFVLVDLTIAKLPTNTFNAIRFFLAGLALLPLFYFSKERHQTLPIKPLLISGSLLGFFLFLGFYAQTEGMRYTSVSNAGFITGMAVPLVSLLGFMFFNKRPTLAVWIGIVVATLGLYFLTTGGEFSFNNGDLLILACAFAFAFHLVFTDKFVKDLPVLSLSIVQIFSVAAYCLAAALLSGDPLFYLSGSEPVSWHEHLFEPIIVFSILVTALLGTAFAYWAQTSCQQFLPSHKVAMVFASEPIFAHGAAWLFLGEHLALMGFMGAGMIIAGMLISELGDKKHPPKINPLDQNATSG